MTKRYEVFGDLSRKTWHVESPTGYFSTFPTRELAQSFADAKNKAQDAAKIADEFHSVAVAVSEIAKILAQNPSLNNSVPKNWPLQHCANEFAVECQEISWHYETLAGRMPR